MKTGLNLYSIRSLIKTEESFISTCKELKKMGFSYLQYSGAPFEVNRIKKELEEVGLPIVLTHVPMDRILNDTYKLMEEHKEINCFNIGLGMMPLDIIKDYNKCIETIQKLNDVARIMHENGFKFFYHFHHFEFLKLPNGERIIDYMIDNAKYINFTADTYWIQYGGGDICEYLKKMSGRIECIHIKDYKIEINSNGELVPNFAAISEGNTNFKPIIEEAKRSGVKYFLIEQDNADNFSDPLQLIKISIDEVNKW